MNKTHGKNVIGHLPSPAPFKICKTRPMKCTLYSIKYPPGALNCRQEITVVQFVFKITGKKQNTGPWSFEIYPINETHRLLLIIPFFICNRKKSNENPQW